MARVAGAMVATAVAPRASEMTTPSKPRSCRSIPSMTVGENTARCSGSIRSYVASETMTNGTPASTALANGLEERIVPGRDRVDDVARVVGVAGHPAEAREVLRGRVDAGRLHPVDERRDMARDGRRIVAVLALELTDGRVPGVGAGRHDVGDRGQIEVDAGGAELAAPRRGLVAELRDAAARPGSRADGMDSNPGPDSVWIWPPS